MRSYEKKITSSLLLTKLAVMTNHLVSRHLVSRFILVVIYSLVTCRLFDLD